MRLLLTLGTILLLSSCTPATDNKTKPTTWNIIGSWYTHLEKEGYSEIYVSDTIMYFQDERAGQSIDQRYFIKGDSIFKCYGTEKNCDFVPIWKIEKLKNDTLWLTVHKDYGDKEYWVRFPKDEKGHYEFKWTKKNSDSLNWAIVYDYGRRRYKYYATITNELDSYDSALNAGHFKWDMNEPTIQEWIKRKRERDE